LTRFDWIHVVLHVDFGSTITVRLKPVTTTSGQRGHYYVTALPA